MSSLVEQVPRNALVWIVASIAGAALNATGNTTVSHVFPNWRLANDVVDRSKEMMREPPGSMCTPGSIAR